VNVPALTLEHQCPQCGAPVSLGEADRLLTCPYCHVRHLLFASDYFRYYLPPRKDFGREVFYIPYWWCRGLRVVIQGMNVKYNAIDRSLCALMQANPSQAGRQSFDAKFADPALSYVPISLGLRSQTLTLKFAESSLSSVCFSPRLDVSDFIATLKRAPPIISMLPVAGSGVRDGLFGFSLTSKKLSTVLSMEQPAQNSLEDRLLADMVELGLDDRADPMPDPYCEFIGETVSLVYSPFFIVDSLLFDAVTGEKVGSAAGLDPARYLQNAPFPKTDFYPALCPDCGRDLKGEKESCMLACDQCRRVYAPSGTGLTGEEYSVAWPIPKADVWLPFWRIAAECTGGSLWSVADFYRFTGTPKPILKQDEDRPFHFMIPAFHAHPELFVKLSKLFTLYIGEIEEPPHALKPHYPISMPASEAFESIPSLLVQTAPAKKKMVERIGGSSFSMKSASLVFVPFEEKHSEYYQPRCNVAISRNALRTRA
jgi:DNA-directed RNA polymerase subunit RPC12/RpoP